MEFNSFINIRKHHLQYIPVSSSFMQVGQKKNNQKLKRMSSVVVSFHLGYNLVGLSLKIKPVKKSAFNNWSNNGFGISVTRRVCFLMICIKKNNAIAENLLAGVYFVQSSFSQASVNVNRNRAGIADISSSHLHILCFGMLV